MPREPGVAPTKKRRPPGPAGTSCLTCKRRRKKCDRGRPKCERCVTTGFECLGYGHIEGDPSSSSLEVPPKDSGHAEEIQEVPFPRPNRSSPELPPEAQSATESSQPDFIPFVPLPPVLGDEQVPVPFGLELAIASPASRLDDQITFTPYDLEANEASPALSLASSEVLTPWSPPTPALFSTSPIITSPEPSSDPDPPQQGALSLGDSWHLINNRLVFQKKPIPRSLSPIPTNTLLMAKFIFSQYERMFSLSFFKPPDIEVTMHTRSKVIQRLSNASTRDRSRLIMFLGAKIIDSFLDGSLPQKSRLYYHWIQRFEQELSSNREPDIDAGAVQSRFTDSLELAFFKLRLTDRGNPYPVLRQMAPTFLQLAFSDPSLWQNEYNLTSVSVAHVVASERHELGHFLFIDLLCSMVYGLPQVLEYDTSAPAIGFGKYPIHGCPVDFLIILADINARCAQSRIADDWQTIEQRLWDWKPPFFDTGSAEPWRAIAQLAVQESWRQALLIYLYMGVCGVSSHDSRVQSSVRQTFQLIQTVKKTDPVHPHFFVQFIIAGACTRKEVHRTLARARLLDMSERGMWLMAGSDFVPVLDHLWHGAAANGQAIHWSDYLSSRQIALPVDE